MLVTVTSSDLSLEIVYTLLLLDRKHTMDYNFTKTNLHTNYIGLDFKFTKTTYFVNAKTFQHILEVRKQHFLF